MRVNSKEFQILSFIKHLLIDDGFPIESRIFVPAYIFEEQEITRYFGHWRQGELEITLKSLQRKGVLKVISSDFEKYIAIIIEDPDSVEMEELRIYE